MRKFNFALPKSLVNREIYNNITTSYSTPHFAPLDMDFRNRTTASQTFLHLDEIPDSQDEDIREELWHPGK